MHLVKTEFDGKSRTKQMINNNLKNFVSEKPIYLQQVYAKGKDNIKTGERYIDIVYLAIVPENTVAKNGYRFCEISCNDNFLFVNGKKFEYTLY